VTDEEPFPVPAAPHTHKKRTSVDLDTAAGGLSSSGSGTASRSASGTLGPPPISVSRRTSNAASLAKRESVARRKVRRRRPASGRIGRTQHSLGARLSAGFARGRARSACGRAQ